MWRLGRLFRQDRSWDDLGTTISGKWIQTTPSEGTCLPPKGQHWTLRNNGRCDQLLARFCLFSNWCVFRKSKTWLWFVNRWSTMPSMCVCVCLQQQKNRPETASIVGLYQTQCFAKITVMEFKGMEIQQTRFPENQIWVPTKSQHCSYFMASLTCPDTSSFSIFGVLFVL